MYAQLGNIKFEGVKGFTSLEETFGVNYAQHERIQGKPRLESVGDILDTISFSMYLHSSFTNPEEDIEAIRVSMKNREILPLVLGNGRVVGNFVIPSFTKTTQFTDPYGNIIEAILSVELLESFSDDPLNESKKKAAESAFATTARNSNVRSVQKPVLSPGMQMSASVYEMQTSGDLVSQYSASVEKNPATAEYYSGRINDVLGDMEDNIEVINGILESVPDIDNLGPSVPSALSGVFTSIQNMKSVLPISDISSFKIFVSQLSGSVSSLRSASTGISNQSIIRRL